MTDRTTQIVDEYATWMRSWSASPRTVKARTTMARSRLKDWGLSGFTTANVQAFLGRDLSKWSRTTYHAHLSCLCGFLLTAGYIAADPMPDVRKPERPKSRPRPLAEVEVARVLGVVQGDVRAWILLGLNAGLRASEIAAIRGEHVQPTGIYVRGKGDVEETLPCHPDLWRLAQDYPRQGFWFPGSEDGHIKGRTVSLRVGNLFTSLGIAGSVHRCRHTFGTRLLRQGVNIRKVQRLMRHATLETTATYTAVDEDELLEAVSMLPSSQPEPLPPAA